MKTEKTTKAAVTSSEESVLRRMVVGIFDPGFGISGGDAMCGADLDAVRSLSRKGFAEWVIGKGYRITEAGRALLSSK